VSERVSGKLSSWGIPAAIGFAVVALPNWSLGQQKNPPKEQPPAGEVRVKSPATNGQASEAFTAWGKVVGGLQAGLGLRPGEKRVYHVGETVQLVVRVRSVSKEAVKFEYLRHFFIENPPVVRYPDGELVRLQRVDASGLHIPREVNLAPGKEAELYQLKLELRPASDATKATQRQNLPWPPGPSLYGEGKFQIQYDRVLGNSSAGTIKLDPALSKLATGKVELEIKTSQNKEAPDEVKIKVDPTLAAELRALDAMRAGIITPFEKVDEAGRKLLEKYQKPEEQGQIYFWLMLVHRQSGLQTPNHIISFAQQALKYPLASRQEMIVYSYWGDMLNAQKTEQPLPEQRKEAAAVYLKGLKLTWQYLETPPAVPNPPPVYEGPEGPEQAARQKAWEHYRDLRDKADFIKDVNYHRANFIRQIADMYHRPPAAAATPAEIDALRKQAAEILQNDAAVARLMMAIHPDATDKNVFSNCMN
jgi:hypothetical protein